MKDGVGPGGGRDVAAHGKDDAPRRAEEVGREVVCEDAGGGEALVDEEAADGVQPRPEKGAEAAANDGAPARPLGAHL